MSKGDLSELAVAGAELAVRVTPKASRNSVEAVGEGLKVLVTAAPEGGKANAAVTKLLARALGLPKSRLTLLRGATSRDKVFRVEP